ncbi:MAG: phage baseplate assembly protein V [Pseudoxanthomonas sp.]
MSLMDAAPSETGLESGGYAKGVAVAIVTQNNDPDGLCRVKVRYPWYDQPRESYWARLAAPMAGKDRGLVLIPEVDDEVLVAFEREDLRFPYVLGALWNGKDKPPEDNGDGRNDKRLFKSRKGHYLLFDDGSKGVVEISLDDGKRLTFDDDGVVLRDNNGNQLKIDAASGAMEFSTSGRLTIKAATIEISATASMDVKASGKLALTGSIVNIN